MIDFRKLVEAGVHFGHQRSRKCPKMDPYVWGIKNDTLLIDVSKTAHCLEKAATFLEDVAAQGKAILWVGTKKSAQDIVFSAAAGLKMPYVSHRWIGGTLSNFGQVKKSITKMLHLEDVVTKSELHPHYTKKEINLFQKKIARLQKNVGGIRGLSWPIGALVLVDVTKERSALKEAVAMGVPVVALVDTNSDPSLVDYVIPANDDAPRSIKLLINYLVEAVVRGKGRAGVEKAAAAQAQEVERASLREDVLALAQEEDTDAEGAGKSKTARKEEKVKEAVKRSKKDIFDKR
ncbi:30S ribosomal protein S2 [Candidatus Dependentiae bacterium HGW-Dependentiae-1]|nr:MAG: 30S ribosomal protein S2 [Candidatus Dependentiae bacterium HGW-Dependentiae-1]